MSDSRKFLYAIAKERKFCYVKLFKKKVVLDFNGCDDTCCCVNCGINGGPNGDLHINITVRPDPIFERDGYDVWTEIPLTYAQATLGDEITVPTVDGKVKYTVPEGTQTGTVFRLRGKGIKKVNRNDHGDHYVRVTVEVPRNLTKEQKEKLRDYEKSLGEKNYAKRKTFFDKLKDKFK